MPWLSERAERTPLLQDGAEPAKGQAGVASAGEKLRKKVEIALNLKCLTGGKPRLCGADAGDAAGPVTEHPQSLIGIKLTNLIGII